MFYILFLNRECLQEFNKFFASNLEMCDGDEEAKNAVIEDDLHDIVRPNFKLNRVNIPKWVERAVFLEIEECV